MKEINLDRIEELVRELLIEIGEDPDREGLIETPKRVAKSLKEITASTRLEKFTEGKMFPTDASPNQQMVAVNNIPFYSMCEHHMLPFFGNVHVGYLPQDGQIIGLSKIPRLVNYAARKLNVQENITREVADVLMEITNAKGVAVVVDARHMCVEMRGVQKVNSITRTNFYLGAFNEDVQLRNEFLQSLPKVNAL
ncbi:GTP cyclohydrolase I FolE [Facklamia sp. 7083-14-GEN3]|uniref:GTP cyclohydrolase I FolE n=1 Tax=Facklamia sp. 7083-14-GEN3 TaxID=2973478 RepID=UPI00215C4A06|nr:GTP cyclohydrolase I FolE [Facklamia sp. 7083-14-GEN3]MCR8969027.1 GTP cyclohydrolase I FolE [Facklamia sp. 7083-14-GEN3]